MINPKTPNAGVPNITSALLPGGIRVPSLSALAAPSLSPAVATPSLTLPRDLYSDQTASESIPKADPDRSLDPNHRLYLELWRDAVRYQFIYSVISLCLGLCCIIGGMTLFLLGVSGVSSWTVGVFGVKSQLGDAAPGTILFVVGLFYVFITRFVIKPDKS